MLSLSPRIQIGVLSVAIIASLYVAFITTGYYYKCLVQNTRTLRLSAFSKQLTQTTSKHDEKLLGIMYMLVRHLDFRKGSTLYNTLDKLKTNFLPNNNYPLLILYDNYSKSSSFQKHQIIMMQSSIKEFLSGTKVIFRETKFRLPSPEINIGRFELVDPYYLGYRYMCRFHAIQAMQMSEFDNVKFVLRLDDDSSIMSPYKKDIFKYFDSENFEYGFVFAFGDARRYMKNFYDFTKNYIKTKKLSTTFFDHWDDEDVLYNNFELSKVSFWRRNDVQDYLTAVDEHGGIFYHRWGDAPIKTMALALFMPWSKMHCFKDIHYKHKIYEHHAQSNICSYIVPTWNRHYKDTWLKKNKSNPVKRIFGTYT